MSLVPHVNIKMEVKSKNSPISQLRTYKGYYFHTSHLINKPLLLKIYTNVEGAQTRAYQLAIWPLLFSGSILIFIPRKEYINLSMCLCVCVCKGFHLHGDTTPLAVTSM